MLDTPRPKKSLGQHFLKDSQISQRIVDMLTIFPADNVLEIGPGPGALTGLIKARNPARLVLVEKDSHWAARHAAGLPLATDLAVPFAPALPPTPFTVIEGDALNIAWEALHGPWKVISNLPYNIGSVLLWDMVRRIPRLERGVFMVQKEVAERLAASPGNKDYGALTVWIQSYVQVEWGFIVAPGSFTPPPKVDSAVVRLTHLPQEQWPTNPDALAKFIKMCFQQRRKQLQSILKKNNLQNLVSVLEDFGINPLARPETLSPQDFQRLSCNLT